MMPYMFVVLLDRGTRDEGYAKLCWWQKSDWSVKRSPLAWFGQRSAGESRRGTPTELHLAAVKFVTFRGFLDSSALLVNYSQSEWSFGHPKVLPGHYEWYSCILRIPFCGNFLALSLCDNQFQVCSLYILWFFKMLPKNRKHQMRC